METKTQSQLCDKLLNGIVRNNDLGSDELAEVKSRIEEKDYEDLIDDYGVEGVRVCSTCGNLMDEGYLISDALEYYCGDECLYDAYDDEEIVDLAIGEKDSGNYWTAWEN